MEIELDYNIFYLFGVVGLRLSCVSLCEKALFLKNVLLVLSFQATENPRPWNVIAHCYFTTCIGTKRLPLYLKIYYNETNPDLAAVVDCGLFAKSGPQ